MPRKENTKAKTWERDRRKRMNAYFKTLADLLPPHQEGRKRNKVDILIHASKYIKDLHSRTEELFSTHASEAHKEELTRLKKLVTQLMSRTQLLSTLLKDAGISVPAEPALEKISPLKWSNKINVDDVDKYFDKIEEKKTLEKKKKEKSTENKVPSKKKSATPSASKKLSEETAAAKNVRNSIENQENRVNCANSKNYNSDSTSSLGGTGSKEAERCQNDSTNETTASGTTNTKKKASDKKVESQKSLKKKRKRKDEKNSTLPPVANTVTNLTPNTLILSGGKLMPLVAPMTSNIIVNTQQASTNPIILGNTQQNQMIVMQPLANRVQNSVVSICNHALINTVQKVTLNTVPSIHTNMVVDSHNWASNVKNIINATKIGGHKGILPKGKEITKTTMAYKVPIPAIHKEKVEKPKDGASKKESEMKAKGNKNHSKSHKSIQSTPETIEELNVEKKSPTDPVKTQEDPTILQKGALKRGLSTESDSADEPEDKKRKDTNGEAKSAQPIAAKAADFTATCKSIVSLKHVIEKIGENIRDEHTPVSNENESVTKSNNVVTQATNDADREKTSTTSKLMDIADTNCFDVNKKSTEDSVASQTVASDKFSSESHEADAPDRSSNEFNISIDSIAEKNGESMEQLDAKSTLTDVEVAEKAVGSDGPKKTCNLATRFDSLLRVATAKEQQRVNDAESNKIILNLDTNTTTTMKSDANIVDVATSASASSSSSSPSSSSSTLIANVVNDEAKLTKTSKDEMSKSLPYTSENTFVPISSRTEGLHSDLSNDIFASLNVPSSSHNPESISPTAAFLMAFPLVSSLNGKTEVLDEEMKDDFKYHSQTPPMLLQIGAMEPNSFKIKTSLPSHTIAEKRLKTSCEEKQITSANVNANTDIIVPVECATTKSLPKVVNEETLREPYKIVQTVLTPSLEKSVVTTSAFPSHTSVNFPAVDSCISNSSSLTTNQGRSGQLRTTSTLNSVNVSIASQAPVNISVSTNKNDIADCTSSQVPTSRNLDVAFSESQDFLPSYSTIVGNGLVSLQHTHTSNSSMFKNAIATPQEANPTVGPRVDNIDSSQNLLSARLENATVTTNSSSAALRSLQADYSTQTKNKGSQSSSHAIYPSHKDTLIDSAGIVPDHRVDYANQMDRGLPVTSQSMQSYSVPTKESSLPILPSQDMQHMYSQTKDSHVLLDLNGTQQTFAVQKKQEHIIASSHNDYIGNQAKAMSQKDSISYTSGDNDAASTPSRNQEYVTKTANQSSENTFQRNYSKLNKSTDTLNSPNQVNQEANDVLGSKTQEQQHNHIRDSAYVPAKKLDVDPFVQSYQYDVKEAMSNPSERTNVLNANTTDTHSNYVSYPSKDDKKTNVAVSTVAMTNNNNKSAAVQQGADIARYSQQTSSFIATSNYEQSTMTENHTKSTTTVAHNSSNFSILSWTTFSPVSGGGGSGNNNLVHYDQGQPHPNDNTEAKTICENYSYIPLHKDNSSFPNQVLIGDNYPSNSTMSTEIDKSRQGKIESQKQSFVDSSKTRNDPSKQNRMQNQQTGNEYKFPDGGKNKNKYGMDSDYIQNDYGTAMDQQQHSQQHGQKNHQNLSSKQEKTVYTYEPQINFDLAESNVQMKYSIEAYTGVNFKYAEKTTQQPNQHKYQVLPQGQISLHDSSDVKHSQQQQQQQPQQSHSSSNNSNNNKSKSNQHQQHAIKAPVNWMMTPEVKHTELVLPMAKELEFCQNNLFTQTPTYNQSTPNQFYNNYDVSAAHSFPNLPVLQSDPKRPAETFYSEDQPFPWSPTKNNVHNSVEHAIGQSSVKCIDQHIVPSSLQSLVSDLDLTTNLEKQNFLFGAPTSRIATEQNKDVSIKEKEATNVSGRDLHAILNTQNTQHPASTFLSVSQLVEHEKAEKNHQHQQTHQQHQHHQHHHPHQHQHSQQQHQQQQQQARKHQRKSNASPRTNSKRQMDIRKSTTTNDNSNLHQRHEEQKSSGHVFTEQGYQQPQQQQQQQQQQKYQQNNVHWRSRNCKSNYTAEALIGTSIHDTGGHQDKHASIKFTNYPQNKFQSGLSADAAVMPINYFSSAPPPDDGTVAGYGQSMVNQNFNTYAYSSNSANSIYPTSNFITSISNTPNSYMAMPLHENATDYVQETNSFLLPNVAGTSSSSSASTVNTSSANTSSTTAGNANGNGKNHQHYGKHPNCDKRSYSTAAKKGKRKALESGPMQNLEFPLSGINSPLEDYHHSTTFLPPPPRPPPSPPPPPPPHANPLYQNHSQTNVYAKTVNGLPPPPPSAIASAPGVATVGAAGFSMNSNMVRGGIVSSNPMAMPHHPSGTSLSNFNLSTIFPEMNDKVIGYKSSNGIPPSLPQTSNQSVTYAQRSNYPSNSLCHLPQVSEGTQFINSVPPLPIPPAPPPAAPSLSHGIIHYKNL